MDNPEEVMNLLERFNVSQNPRITSQLEEYITFVARTGDSVYAWSLVKNLYREKLVTVITDFYNETPTKGKKTVDNKSTTKLQTSSNMKANSALSTPELPQYPNVDPFNYETMKKMLIEKLESFAAAPFTIQRISELLSDPRKQYSRIDKFMRAVEKTILVVSHVQPGRHRSESENGDSLDSALNGDFATEVNVDIDMEHDGTFTKELSVVTPRKQASSEVSEATNETVTIKKNVSPTKEEVAGTSEGAGEKSQKKEVIKDTVAEVKSPDVAKVATEAKEKLEAEPEVKEAPSAPTTSSTENEEHSVKADIPIVQQPADETLVSKPALEETLLNEPIRSSDNEILIDTAEIISQTTPLAALENIVAVRTEPVADVVEQAEQKAAVPSAVSPEPETNESRDEVIVQTPAASVKDDSESESKRMRISEELETTESELKVEAEPVVKVEKSIPEVVEKSLVEPVESTVASKALVEEAIPPIPAEAAAATIPPVAEPVVEEKIDEPLPEIAEIPIEIVPSSEDIAEAPSTDMDTVPIINENKMSLDEDEPPAIELEMTPIANKMDTDEADAAPMDFEDSSNEPMDQ